jgi:hypothetical protein
MVGDGATYLQSESTNARQNTHMMGRWWFEDGDGNVKIEKATEVILGK